MAEKEKVYVKYPKGMKQDKESSDKTPMFMYQGMVFDDHVRNESNEHWVQICKDCVKEMPRLINGIHELPDNCKEDYFKCGAQDCGQPATHYIDLPYSEMVPVTVKEPEPRKVVKAGLEYRLEIPSKNIVKYFSDDEEAVEWAEKNYPGVDAWVYVEGEFPEY